MTGKSLALGVMVIAAAGAAGYLTLRTNASDAVSGVATPSVTVPPTAPVGEPAARPPAAPRPGRTDEAAPAPSARQSSTRRDQKAEAVLPPAPVPVPADAQAPPAATPPTVTAPPAVSQPQATAEIPTPAATSTSAPAPVSDIAKPRVEEVTIGEDQVIGIRLDQTITSTTARVEDRVTAAVSRDIMVGRIIAVPAGARLEGVVAVVERGGKMRERARIGIRFSTLILANNLRVPIQTAVIMRDGASPAGDAGSKIGASAVVGAILGAVIGGKKGAAIGTAAGAAGGTAVVMAGDGNPATIQAGSMLTLRLTAPVTVLIERDQRP